MEINHNSNIIYFKDCYFTENDMEQFYLPIDEVELLSNITNYQGEYYYYKQITNEGMVREFIGCNLAKKVDLETVDYKMGKKEENSEILYALSKLFFKSGFRYQNCYTAYGATSERLLTNFELFLSYVYLNNYKLLERLENDYTILKILKLTAVDLKMGQIDRHRNLFLEIDEEGNIDLAPIFDYGYSYFEAPVPDRIYDNPFLIFRKNRFSLKSFTKRFPEFLKYVSFLDNIPISEVLDEIERDHHVIFDEKERNYYQKMDQRYHKVLQKIIK